MITTTTTEETTIFETQSKLFRILEVVSPEIDIDSLKGDSFKVEFPMTIRDNIKRIAEEKEFELKVEIEGVFGYKLQKWNSTAGIGYEEIDSCYGFIGRFDLKDNNHYIVNELIEQITSDSDYTTIEEYMESREESAESIDSPHAEFCMSFGYGETDSDDILNEIEHLITSELGIDYTDDLIRDYRIYIMEQLKGKESLSFNDKSKHLFNILDTNSMVSHYCSSSYNSVDGSIYSVPVGEIEVDLSDDYSESELLFLNEGKGLNYTGTDSTHHMILDIDSLLNYFLLGFCNKIKSEYKSLNILEVFRSKYTETETDSGETEIDLNGTDSEERLFYWFCSGASLPDSEPFGPFNNCRDILDSIEEHISDSDSDSDSDND